MRTIMLCILFLIGGWIKTAEGAYFYFDQPLLSYPGDSSEIENYMTSIYVSDITVTYDTFSKNFDTPVQVLKFHDHFLGEVGIDNLSVTPVPVPGALWLLGSGLISFVGLRKKIQRKIEEKINHNLIID
jgi:hypothetical protein